MVLQAVIKILLALSVQCATVQLLTLCMPASPRTDYWQLLRRVSRLLLEDLCPVRLACGVQYF